MKSVIFNLSSMVLLLTHLLSVVLIGCGNDTSQQMPIHNKKDKIQPSFIVGGHPVQKDSLQAAVALRVQNSSCTGTLNSPTEISTAAHCLFGLIPREAIKDMISKMEKIFLDQGKQNQDEMKILILEHLTDFIESHIEGGIEIYFASDTNFTPGMVKEIKHH